MTIRILSGNLASRIAAGEVIERPASVVKELVENALDAGAKRIDVEVRTGGCSLIRVVDDGLGIPAGELETAFQRFATSKIDETSNLIGIATLGFRGEALPSIASVSHVDVTSRPPGQAAAARRVIEFGSVMQAAAAGAPEGTSISVTQLFRNVPARLKFLSSPGSELGRLQQVVAVYALGYPEVSFRLVSDGGTRLATTGDGDLRQAIAAIYGSRVAGAMLAVGGDGTGAFAVSGAVGDPSISRGNRSYMTLFVNGRWVQSRRIAFAVEQSYHGFLPERRFPIAALRIRAPLDDVDVNVHPAKAEVRFLREDIVFAEVQRVVRSTLLAAAPVPGLNAGRFTTSRLPTNRPDAGGAQAAPYALWPAAQSARAKTGAAPDETKTSGATSPVTEQATIRADTSREQSGPVSPHRSTPASALPVLRVIGQAQETYILAEGPDGVYLIDQHAAHERVLYEEIRARIARKSIEAQPLLEPAVVELSPEQAGLIEDHMTDLTEAGFLLEPFGHRAALLRAVPVMLAHNSSGGAAADALIAILDRAADGARTDAWQDRFLYSLACHSAVRAGRRMNREEGVALVRRLEKAEQPHTCPHGRPTMIHLSAGALEREFKRA